MYEVDIRPASDGTDWFEEGQLSVCSQSTLPIPTEPSRVHTHLAYVLLALMSDKNRFMITASSN